MGKIQIIAKASLINFTTKITIGSDMGETLARRVGGGSKKRMATNRAKD